MEIVWLGHSCFLIKGKERAIITDPYRPDPSCSWPEPRADIVTISHFHPGHSYIEGVAGNPKQVNGPGEYEIEGIFITGTSTFHDNEKGKLRGNNTVYLVEMDGVALCHLGDLGHGLTSQLIEEIGAVDILFLPVGEVNAINIDTAIETLRQLEARIVVPMHYKTDVLPRDLAPLSKFLTKMGVSEAESRPKLSITASSMPPSAQVVVLDCKRG
ncbi:MAG: MBL fold metallo-hydrolase [Dehalococcoidia bacterium]|nr:MBL fold metallo-hydrolase [Dehalococcoidia bacterium]